MIDGRPTGVLRASMGKDSLWEDVDALLQFILNNFVNDSPSRRVHKPDSLAIHGHRRATLRAIYVYRAAS